MERGDSHQQDLFGLHWLRGWMPLTDYPENTRFDHEVVVQSKRQYSCSTSGCETNDMCAAIRPGKMILPTMKAWIEERRRLCCFRIEAVGLAPFEFIAAIACGA